MSGQSVPKLILGVALVGASAALAGVGVVSLTTDASAPVATKSDAPIVVPAPPPPVEIAPVGSEAFTRPLFNSERAQGPDKAPIISDNGDPSSPSADDPDANPDDMSQMTVKGIIVSERGARAALQAAGSGALTWVRVGDEIAGWKVESITSARVRISNGEETAEIRIRDDK